MRLLGSPPAPGTWQMLPAPSPTRRYPPAVAAALAAPPAPIDSSAWATETGQLAAPPPGMQVVPPLEAGEQGIQPAEASAGRRLIRRLVRTDGIALVATFRDGLYELHGPHGSLRYRRLRTPHGQLVYQIVEVRGRNPLPDLDPFALQSWAEERANAGGPNRAAPHSRMSYPDLLGRLAAVFDDRNSPDITYMQRPGSDPNHHANAGGSHGAGGIIQSRAPLIMAGPGIARSAATDVYASIVDVAPTIADFLGIPPVVGASTSGARRLQHLRWQDGRSLAPAIADARYGAMAARPQRAVMFVIDGLSHSMLERAMRTGQVPNIAAIAAAGTRFSNGQIAGIPSVTWPGHNSLATGATPGAHGIVNNFIYDRELRREHPITDGGLAATFFTSKLLSNRVETLFEAVERGFGPTATTASLNNPAARGADIALLEARGLPTWLMALPGAVLDLIRSMLDPAEARLRDEKGFHKNVFIDSLATRAGMSALSGRNPAKFAMFEFTLTDSVAHEHGPQHPDSMLALRETDRRIGMVLRRMAREGTLASSMLVVTADHGMETQGGEPVGAWKAAIRDSGVKAIDSTRFLYLKTMRVAGIPRELAAGRPIRLELSITDDDRDLAGGRPPLAGATVVIRDATGRVVARGTAAADGTVSLDAGRLPPGSYRVEIDHEEFTPITRRLLVR